MQPFFTLYIFSVLSPLKLFNIMTQVLAKTLWVFLFFTLTISKFTLCIGVCKENEQHALESLKKEVYGPKDNFPAYSSWVVGKDCCKWEGIVCHNLTHHVIELHIVVLNWGLAPVVPRINNLEWLPSLVNLQHLEISNMDLSRENNWLQVIHMLPSLVDLSLFNCSLQHMSPLLDHHNFSSLETLHLSHNNFSSSVPSWVFGLDNLVSLDLSHSNFIGPLPEASVNLTSLKTFSVAENFFNCPLPKWLFDLHNLETLDLSNCGIEGLVSNLISNMSSLTTIYLSLNALSGKLPNVIGKLWRLESLQLSDNIFEGEISELFKNSSNFLQQGSDNRSALKELHLWNNKLTGTLPRSIGLLSMLESLTISNNRLEGIVTESHFTKLMQLKVFYASGINLTLKVSQSWIPPFQALSIWMGGWNLGPQVPMWLQTQKVIMSLDISNCGMEGEVPSWFWNFSSQLDFLNISHNQFVGQVPNTLEAHQMFLASNNFSGPLPQISTMVSMLDLSNNSFSGGLAHLLCKKKNESYALSFLNLGGNNLPGEIPDCWVYWLNLEVLILRHNNLIGGIPRSIKVLSNLKSLDLGKNSLTGSLPSSLGNCANLRRLDLDGNRLVGQLPPWLGTRLSRLIILSIRSNKFHGELPLELCHLDRLQIIDLANNAFFGVIPRCINNFKAMVTGRDTLEVGDELSYYDPFGSNVRESEMVATKGNMYQYNTILALVTNMDMSNNNLSGDIPTCLTSLEGLRFCNFSKNHLTGRIPNGIADMKVLESFDLSENQLSGQIPQGLSSLSTLAYLNLSYNNLSGTIPRGTQLQSFDPSSFQGNKLCGLPLLVNCSSQVPDIQNEEDESDEDELDWFYIAMAIGFALSFWGVGASLIFIRSWRHGYYRFLDSTWNSVRVKLRI